MTQEDKELLLKDLCARWRYGVKAQIRRASLNLSKPVILDLPIKGVINFASTDSVITVTENGDIVYDPIGNCKPYLRPMSSMTEEEDEWLNDRINFSRDDEVDKVRQKWGIVMQEIDINSSKYVFSNFTEILDWLNAHHFDYRGLIENGLAIEAPEGMYN